jgi:hypothetical protein
MIESWIDVKNQILFRAFLNRIECKFVDGTLYTSLKTLCNECIADGFVKGSSWKAYVNPRSLRIKDELSWTLIGQRIDRWIQANHKELAQFQDNFQPF